MMTDKGIPLQTRFLALFIVTILVGCVFLGTIPAGAWEPEPPTKDDVRTLRSTYPSLSAENVYDEIATISQWHRYRGTPTHHEARDYIKGKMENYGLNTSLQEYKCRQRAERHVQCYNILGALEVNDSNRWVIIGAHYDATEASNHAAYDNAAGVAHMLEIARAYTQELEPPEVNYLFAAWDSEEGGGAGSYYYVANMPTEMEVLAYINLDMFGLNYPISNRLPTASGEYLTLYLYTSPVENFAKYATIRYTQATKQNFTIFRELIDEIVYTNHSLPEQYVPVMDDNEAISDHKHFVQYSIPAVWFRGIHDRDTEELCFKHTPLDTLRDMEFYAGGKGELLKGFELPLKLIFDISQQAPMVFPPIEEKNEEGQYSTVPGMEVGPCGILAAVAVLVILILVARWYVNRRRSGREMV
jgi:hypothetical protein